MFDIKHDSRLFRLSIAFFALTIVFATQTMATGSAHVARVRGGNSSDGILPIPRTAIHKAAPAKKPTATSAATKRKELRTNKTKKPIHTPRTRRQKTTYVESHLGAL